MSDKYDNLSTMKSLRYAATFALLVTLAAGGCSEAISPTSASSLVKTAAPTLAPAPDTKGMALDQARLALEDAGYELNVRDSRENRSIVAEGNWIITSQNTTGSTATLGARKVTDKSDEEIAAEQVAADEAARVAAEQVAADEAARVAAEKAAADEAARLAQEQQQAPPAPAPAPAEVSYANCTEAKAAGAAPIYEGEPGYRAKLDRDKDGIACES